MQPLALGNGTAGCVSPTQTQRHRVAWLWVAADQQWYSANVVAHDAAAQTHHLVYHINGKVRSSDVHIPAFCVLPCWGTAPAAATPWLGACIVLERLRACYGRGSGWTWQQPSGKVACTGVTMSPLRRSQAHRT